MEKTRVIKNQRLISDDANTFFRIAGHTYVCMHTEYEGDVLAIGDLVDVVITIKDQRILYRDLEVAWVYRGDENYRANVYSFIGLNKAESL